MHLLLKKKSMTYCKLQVPLGLGDTTPDMITMTFERKSKPYTPHPMLFIGCFNGAFHCETHCYDTHVSYHPILELLVICSVSSIWSMHTLHTTHSTHITHCKF